MEHNKTDKSLFEKKNGLFLLNRFHTKKKNWISLVKQKQIVETV